MAALELDLSAAHKNDEGPELRARRDRYYPASLLIEPEAYAELYGGAQDAILESRDTRGEPGPYVPG